MTFRELIDSLAEKVGLKDGIELDEENRCLVEFDGMGVVIQGDDDLRMLSLLSPLGEPPPERLEVLYRALLEANHLFGGTFGATLSIDPSRGWVYLCKNLSYAALDGEGLAGELENFMNTVERWCAYVKNFRASADAAADAEGVVEPSLDDAFLRV